MGVWRVDTGWAGVGSLIPSKQPRGDVPWLMIWWSTANAMGEGLEHLAEAVQRN